MDRKELLLSLFIVACLALIISPFASPWPDGLEKVAEDKGFLEKSETAPIINAPIPDYAWPGIKSEKLATSAAGAFGTFFTFGLAYTVAFIIKGKG